MNIDCKGDYKKSQNVALTQILCSLQIEREAAFSQFTMIIITGIRDIHINSIREDGGSSLARNLAHVYHFYLFGERGRSGNMKLPALSNSRVPVSILRICGQ